MAKRILPWFGGSAAVWSTCLVFYQCVLLAGYAYADALTRKLSLGTCVVVHIAIVFVSLFFLPIGPGDSWRTPDVSRPTGQMLQILLASIGLPFGLLSSTSPLLQAWTARVGSRVPYWLFAVSNLASLCALLSYPLIVEPTLTLQAQTRIWSSLYLLFTALLIGTGLLSMRSARQRDVKQDSGEEETNGRRYVLVSDYLMWFALSACGATLLLAITNHLAANVAAAPLLWVLPLAVYLLTFVVTFRGSRRPLNQMIWLRLLAVALGILAYAIFDVNAIQAVQINIPIFLGGLYICCYYLHAELYARRPGPSHLTGFYLSVAAGGAAGAFSVGLVAPEIFSGVYELPVVLALTAGLTTLLVWQRSAWPLRALWGGVCACMVATVISNVHAYRENTLSLRRSFYGSLRVVQSPRAGPEQTRTLFHGTIEHGAQYIHLPKRLQAGTYYGPDSGIGILLRRYPKSPKRVGVIGLGTGTIAAFGQAGDAFRFFEINGQVSDIAQSLFTYLRESKARTDVVEGDGRLALAHDTGLPYNVLILDAFSGDAIPVHLLTAEAMRMYRNHLAADGVIVIHVSNDFLDLPPVVTSLAEGAKMECVLIHDSGDSSEGTLPSDWMLLTANGKLLDDLGLRARATPVNMPPGLALWTDDYNNLLQILKTPKWK